MGFYTYGYIDPRTNEPFYVGKGKHNRYLACLSGRTRNSRLTAKINKIRSLGLEPRVVFWNSFDTEVEAYDNEQFLIKLFGRIEDGGSLLNIVLGGKGVSGLSHKDNPKVAAAGILNAERVNSDKVAVEKRSAFLRAYSKLDSTRALRKEITKQLHKDPERSKRMKEGLRKGNTPEMWAKRTEKMKVLYADPEWNRKRVEKAVAARLANKLAKKEAG